MERYIVTGQEVWSNDHFKDIFNFREVDNTLTKEVNGQIYSFKEVVLADDLKNVVDLQKTAWEWDDRELAPVHILALMKDTGGGVFGAYDEKGKMVGFAAGFGGGVDPITNKPILISSMLAMVGKDYRSKGIGKELKMVQAYYAFQNGYTMMKWLYDPERGENASLNLTKLGAMAEEFYIDKYGIMKSNLYGPVPTDRFRAVWRFTENKPLAKLLGDDSLSDNKNLEDLPVATTDYMPIHDRVLIQISSDIDKETEEDKIKRRFRLREILTNYFLEKNYIATEFISNKSPDGRQNFYLLEPLMNVIKRGDITI